MKEILDCLQTKVFLADDYADLSYGIGNLGTSVLWVCDSNTARMVRPLPEPNFIFESGDSTKNFQTIEKLISVAYDNRLDKNCFFLAMGGGTVCDVASFASALYMGGSRLALVPTTLQAMVDSCIGGQAFINYKNTRNMLGMVKPAQQVIICPELLKSLSNKEFNNGISEILKHAVLADSEELLKLLLINHDRILEKDLNSIIKLILMSLVIKKNYLEDENRKLGLELGHTFAFALESLRNFSHGVAVAWGLVMSFEASVKLGLCDQRFKDSFTRIMSLYGFDISFRINRGEWMTFRDFLMKDNKRFDGRINFILPTGQGTFNRQPVDEELIKEIVIRAPGE